MKNELRKIYLGMISAGREKSPRRLGFAHAHVSYFISFTFNNQLNNE